MEDGAQGMMVVVRQVLTDARERLTYLRGEEAGLLYAIASAKADIPASEPIAPVVLLP
jgi:hypothetical protein